MILHKPIGLAFLALVAVADANARENKGSVEPAKLSALIKQANKIVVFEEPVEDATVLFSSTNVNDIAEFNKALTVVVPSREDGFHCMCLGSPAIRLYRGETELALISNHHGLSVRSSLWTSDAMLKDTEKWLRWFDARKLPGPRKEVEDMATRAKEREASYARWLGAMPKPLRPFWDRAIEDELNPKLEPLRSALTKEIPDTRQRALALFAWFGSGKGPWSGYPVYETVAEELLLDLSTSDLVTAISAKGVTQTQLEGAARLFAGWNFLKRRPDDKEKLPEPLKRMLLEHSLKSTDADKQSRAKSAFAQ
jgi:hypothetical protein